MLITSVAMEHFILRGLHEFAENMMIFPIQNFATTYLENLPKYDKKQFDKNQINGNKYCDINYNQKRFYPHYGAAPLRRHTRLYKKGKTKGKNRKLSKTKRESKLTSFLASNKRGRKEYSKKYWKKIF